jgi:hypothetical protein
MSTNQQQNHALVSQGSLVPNILLSRKMKTFIQLMIKGILRARSQQGRYILIHQPRHFQASDLYERYYYDEDNRGQQQLKLRRI